MTTKVLFICITRSIFILIWVFLVMKNTDGEQSKPIRQESSKKDMIIIYKKEKALKVMPDAKCFKELKDEIEDFTTNIDNGYELIPSELRFNRIKKKGYAVELIYASPKELKIDFLTSPIRVNRIFIPLSGGDFPFDCVFIYEAKKKFPHILANTKQSKDKFLELIKLININRKSI